MDGQGEMFMGNKKKNIIDDDNNGKNNKKHKKNVNKSLANAKLIQEFQQKKKQSQKSKPNQTGKKKIESRVQKKIDDIKSILEHHKQSTILKALENNNYNQQQALNELFNIEPDQNQPESFPISQNDQKMGSWSAVSAEKQQLANDLINQIYDNKQQIDPSQFQQLFAEITQIIQREQKNNGMDVFEINQFIDDCYLMKNVILEDQNEIYIDQNDQLCRQTEIFMQQLIKKQVAQQIKRQQDFPTLGSDSKNKGNVNNKKSTIQLIQQSYKQQSMEQEYFTPNKTPQIYHRLPSNQEHSLFTINNNPRSYSDVLQLSKEYNQMGIDKLKFIYLRLEDINLCKRFLQKYYSDKKRQIRKEKVQDGWDKQKKSYANGNVNGGPLRKNSQKFTYKRLEDENFKDYTLQQIRDELDHLFKRRTVFKMTRGRITNVAHRKQLERLSHLDDPRIEKLSQVARFKTIQQMASSNPQYIDLHGYREQEIEQIFYQIEDMIKQLFKKGSSKLETVKSGNNIYVVIKAMTGKGLHSKYGKSVLKPCVKNWCVRNNIKCTQTEDSINVYIEVR